MLSVDQIKSGLPLSSHVTALTVGTIETMPPGSKLVDSLRYSGYTYWEAISEQLDNSLDARATRTWVELYSDEDPNKKTRAIEAIGVIDNGTGMTHDELKESHRFGSDRMYAPNDIGKFGLGGITGAISIGQKMTTITRKDGQIHGRITDLVLIKERNQIVSIALREEEIEATLLSMFKKRLGEDDSGTMIFIEKLDKMSAKRVDSAKTVLMKRLGEIYYSPLYRRTLEMYIDNDRVPHSHPIMWDVKGVKKLASVKFTMPDPTTGRSIKFELDVADVSDAETSTPNAKATIKKQGGYLERGGRLIVGGVTNNPASGVEGLWAHHAAYRDCRWLLRFEADADPLVGVGYQKKGFQWNKGLNDKVATIVMPHAKNIKHNAERAAQPKTPQLIEKLNKKLNSGKNTTNWVVSIKSLSSYGGATDNTGTEIRLNDKHPLVQSILSGTNFKCKTLAAEIVIAIEKAFAELGEHDESKEVIKKLHTSISNNLAQIV